MEFIFKTDVTMKPYNAKKYWICNDYVDEIYISAQNLKSALKEYAQVVDDKYFITVSKNAIKNRQPMFTENKNGISKQTGYVITGKTDIENTEQYVDMWVKIISVTDTFFE